MSNRSDSNRRIARNTIFLYFRMMVVMGVTLYTTRVVIEALGEVDYGIYNVVGGLSASFIFFSSALTNATQRFLNFEIGASSDNSGKLNRIFCLSFLIYAVIAISVLIVGGSVGTWYIHTRMVLPPDRVTAATVTLWAMLLSLVMTFIGAVYESVLIARENMKIYAYIGLFDAAAKLLVAFGVLHSPSSRLILYAVLWALMQIISKAVVILYCRRQYSETKLSFYWNRTLFIDMFAFAGWNVFGTGVWAVNEQGVTLLINKFFGVTLNAARGITGQIASAINNLSTSFFTAIRPQMIQSYASGDLDRFSSLIYSGSRYSVYLMWVICQPVILRIDTILNIWLTEMPPFTAIFVRWSLIYSMINVLTNPLWCAVQAVGKLKTTILYGSSFFLLAFPISWIMLRHGAAPQVTYQVLSAIRVGYVVICFMILKGFVPTLTNSGYFMRAILPSLLVCIVSCAIMVWLNGFFPQNFFGLIAIGASSLVINAVMIFTLGLDRSERTLILSKILKK